MAAIDRILVATDFSVDSLRALDYGKEFARRFGAEIILLHVDEALAVVPGSDLAERHRIAAERELDGTVAELRRKDFRVRGLLQPGKPATEIVKVAEAEHAGLIVIGTHGRTGLSRVLMGSVAERVLRRASCPVLTVRHPERPVEPAAGA